MSQVILHYPGSYVSRPHTIILDSKEDFDEFLAKKSCKLKPNAKYGVFTLDSILDTSSCSKKITITKVDGSVEFPEIQTPEIEIKNPEKEIIEKETIIEKEVYTGPVGDRILVL